MTTTTTSAIHQQYRAWFRNGFTARAIVVLGGVALVAVLKVNEFLKQDLSLFSITSSSNATTTAGETANQTTTTSIFTSTQKQQQETDDDEEEYSLRNMTGTWMGVTWIPPHPWRHYSVQDMQEAYHGRNILWIGDSTARRTSMVHFSILNATTNSPGVVGNDSSAASSPLQPPLHISVKQLERDVDLNKAAPGEMCDKWINFKETNGICRPLYPRGGQVALLPKMCLQHLRDVLAMELAMELLGENNNNTDDGRLLFIKSFDVIIISLGIWHDVRPYNCRLAQNETISTLVEETMHILANITARYPMLRVIWRTGGWQYGRPHEQHFATLEMNRAIMDTVDASYAHSSSMSYVNWGDAVLPRSFEDRIRGDVKPHYGLEPRQQLVQMVTNQLERMDRIYDASRK